MSCKANRYLEGSSKHRRYQLQRLQSTPPPATSPSQESTEPQETAATRDIRADGEQRQSDRGPSQAAAQWTGSRAADPTHRSTHTLAF